MLDDFTYSDDNAINIKMKQGAKARWMTSYSGGIGLKSHGGLWNYETFAMRLKPSFQTILTYKTNNIGKNIRRETDKLLSFDTEIGLDTDKSTSFNRKSAGLYTISLVLSEVMIS